jgi:hypothetical protein
VNILFYAGALLAALVAAVVAALNQEAVVVVLGSMVVVALMLAARRRVRRRITEVTVDPRLAPELVLFPLVVSVRQSQTVTVALLAGLVFLAICRKRNDDASASARFLPFALLALSAVVVFRTELAMPAAIAGLAVFFLWQAAVKFPREVALPSLATGVAVYLVANVLGQLAHIPSPLDASRLGGYDTSAGFFGARLAFPFARSINEPAVITAAYIALVAAMWMLGRRVGFFRWAGVLAGAYIMLGSNSRLPLIIAILLIAATLVGPGMTRRLTRPIVVAAGALPFYLPVALPVIGAVAASVANVSYLARGQSVEEIIGLGTRGAIWNGSTHWWLSRISLESQLFGFGPNGHAVSGANSTYLSGLGGFLADRTHLTMHNSFLQQLFDGGLLGLGLLAVGLLIAMRRYSKDVSLLPQLVFVTVLGVGAASEIILAPGFTQTPFFLLLALAAFSPAVATAEAPRRNEPLKRLTLPERRLQTLANLPAQTSLLDGRSRLDAAQGYRG